MLLKTGELTIESMKSSNVSNTFGGRLYIFQNGILVSQILKKGDKVYEEISQGMFEWSNLTFNENSQKPTKKDKEITIKHTNRDCTEIIYKFRSPNGSSTYELADILYTSIMTEKSNYNFLIEN